jgi:phosphoglycolate phosphatase
MIKLVIFDIDGTLVDAYGAIAKSLNHALKKLGYPPVSVYRARRAVGFGDVEFIRRFFREGDVREAVEIYRRHHAMSLLRHSRVLRSTKRVLRLLKSRGCRLAIVSNRPDPFCGILLDHLDLEKYFDMILCARDKEEIKPSPKMLLRTMRRLGAKKSETLYVGDMTVDVKAGRNAGIKTVAIVGGSSSRAELERERPSKIIRDLKALPAILRLKKF